MFKIFRNARLQLFQIFITIYHESYLAKSKFTNVTKPLEDVAPESLGVDSLVKSYMYVKKCSKSYKNL